MNAKRLIDMVVQQTTVLVAQLATTSGIRAPLAHLANQVFLELSRELDQQGISRKVAADMFGLALRSYQLKVRRLHEGAVDSNRSRWEAILAFIQSREVARRTDILKHFAHDDPSVVSSILQDLVDSGLIFQSGRHNARTYRVTTAEEHDLMLAAEDAEVAPWLVWLTIYRDGPLSEDDLEARLQIDKPIIDRALKALVAEGRIACTPKEEGPPELDCAHFLMPVGEEAGWEAALFDHFNAVVNTLGRKVAQIGQPTPYAPYTGGSTFRFDLDLGHPLRDEVLGQLAQIRGALSDLRQRVTATNEGRSLDGSSRHCVTVYVGQSVSEEALDAPNDALRQGLRDATSPRAPP